MTLVTAINRYFGRKENQTLTQFAAEIKALMPKDKTELAEMLTKTLGEEVTTE